ncbi:helix-turn-helix domain-containing protein [Novisyntrophococcus fermenticellae]|uniref:helix-turn-helix domain-containing protein n=1 Tax=Novisyntrophococcus fermenticellae TaxID=2068655 RepID=UPI001E4A6D4B|nr:helix-turn-helix transcriptional regulator [Novisyntrophococcus fermenticellae]
MLLGEVIRKYRKIKNMTQEELAGRLGITAPAVNKWENGVSFPDITLLAPIARLLNITLDTLLSFREDLTEEEIGAIVYEADSMLKEKPYEEAFQWAKKKLEEYPNCEHLIWQIAVIFDAQRMAQEITNPEDYDPLYLYLKQGGTFTFIPTLAYIQPS